METREYRTIDKSAWEVGEWQAEPDKRQWQDEKTKLPCLIVRGPSGALCGYVGVAPGHPLHGSAYGAKTTLPRETLVRLLTDREVLSLYSDDLDSEEGISVESILPAHGGITFAEACVHGAESSGICHVPAPGEPDNVWWFGFDCAHAGDFTPGTNHRLPADLRDHIGAPTGWGRTIQYRNVGYVEAECRTLAEALASLV